MKYLNIDVMGNVFEYDTNEEAISMSYRLPYRWKSIAFEVARS